MAYQEGATATNKETGQRYIFRGGKWEELTPPPTSARMMGANLSPTTQGAMTFGQGATFNMLDELAGAAALGQMGQSYAMGGTNVAPTRADYTAPRDIVRGGTERFADTNPNLALGLERN